MSAELTELNFGMLAAMISLGYHWLAVDHKLLRFSLYFMFILTPTVQF